jgi:predicted membrane-bound dolichyl-phosphate-mannose-protein mannosyltransferase
MTDHVSGLPAPGADSRRGGAPPRRFDAWLAGLLLAVVASHVAIANLPSNAFVFDEAYYVPAARDMLAGLASNTEHPPLAKALIAASIRIVGDVAYAWRLPSIVFGTVAIWLVYALARRLTDRRTARLAAFLLSFETLWFIHSSIAMLDVVAVALGLAALLVFLRGQWVWAGAIVGLSMLAKEMAVLLLLVVPLFTLLQAEKALSRAALARAAAVTFFVSVSAILVFLAGLQVYDSAYEPYPTAFHHLGAMLRHNQAIAAPPASDAVRPFQWFSGFAPSGYLLSFSDAGNGMKRYYAQFYGQPNLVVLLLIWLSLPFAIRSVARKDAHATLHVLLFLVSLVFFVGLAQWRITYPYYMLILLPSVCALNATFLAQFPRGVVATYGAGVILWFLAWFPRNLLTLGMK